MAGLLPGAGGRRDGALLRGKRRPVPACRFRPAKGDLGRAACRPLPRRHGLQHAAADAGFYRARNAQPRRAARTAPKGFSRARPCPSPGAGQADRLSRPRSGARRSRLCRRAGRAADIEAIRGRARPADRRKVGIEMGHGAVFRQPVRRYGLCRRRRSRRQCGVADSEPVWRIRLLRGCGKHRRHPAKPRRLFLARSQTIPIASSPARSRCIR